MSTTYQITDPTSGSTFLSTGAQATQTTTEVQNVTGSANQNATLSLSNTNWVAFRFNSGAGATPETWLTISAWLTAQANGSDTGNVYFSIYNDNAGLPGTLNTSDFYTVGTSGLVTTLTPTQVESAWDLAGSWAPSNSTYYWAVFNLNGASVGTYGIGYDNSTGTGVVATSSNSGSTWGAIAGTGYFALGQGTGHSVVASTITGHAIDATTVNGTAVQGVGTGTNSIGGFFKCGPSGWGVYIDATNKAAFSALTIIGNLNGASPLQVKPDCSVSATRYAQKTRTTTTSTSITTTDGTIWVNANNLTITLPAAAAAYQGHVFEIANINSHTGTTVASAGGNVGGAGTDATTLAGANAFGKWRCDATNWWRVG